MRVRKFTAYTPLIESRAGRVSTKHRSVDAGNAGRVFKDITLIKKGLGNRKDKNFYTEPALRDGVRRGLFEGLRAYVDHPTSIDEEIQPERTVRDFCGLYENAYYDDKTHAVRADFRIVGPQNRWLADTIDELIAAGHGDKIGLSINGRGETEPQRMQLEESGVDEEVNALKQFIELRSTDVVTEAGAGGGFPALLESARRAKESGTMKSKEDLQRELREAVRKGDMPKAQKTQKLIDALPKDTETTESDEDDEKPAKGKKTKEMGTFMPKKKKKTAPGYVAEAAEEGDEDDDDEDVDHEAELDEAADAAANGDEDDDADEDDDEDLEESDDEDDEDEDDDEDEGDEVEEADEPRRRGEEAPAHLRAARRHREHMAQSRTREALSATAGSKGPKITGATGSPSGKIKSGGGKFNKPTKMSKRGSNIPQPPSKLPWGRKKKRTKESREVVRENALLREANRRLREDVTRRQTADRAKKLLRESEIPPAVRATLLPDMIGMSEQDMRRYITKHERILESVVSAARGDMGDDDYDVVEGNGSSLRESFGHRGHDDDIAGIFAEVGLPMKGGD